MSRLSVRSAPAHDPKSQSSSPGTARATEDFGRWPPLSSQTQRQKCTEHSLESRKPGLNPEPATSYPAVAGDLLRQSEPRCSCYHLAMGCRKDHRGDFLCQCVN